MFKLRTVIQLRSTETGYTQPCPCVIIDICVILYNVLLCNSIGKNGLGYVISVVTMYAVVCWRVVTNCVYV